MTPGARSERLYLSDIREAIDRNVVQNDLPALRPQLGALLALG